MNTSATKMMMNIFTGSVDTEENWAIDLHAAGESFESSSDWLVEVVSDEDGYWVKEN